MTSTRRGVLAAGFALGVVIFVRLWLGAATEDQARRLERLRVAAGVLATERPLEPALLDKPVELHPRSGAQAPKPILAETLREHPVVLLNFWATWCPPCLDELRSLQRLGKRLKGRGVRVVAVSYDDDWPAQLAIFSRLLGTQTPAGVLWARDPQGQDGDTSKMLRSAIGTVKLPETWILTKDGIVGRLVGAQDWDKDVIGRYLTALARGRP